MKSLKALALVGFGFASLTISAQETTISKTDVNKHVDVVKVYEQVEEEGYGTPFIYKELANAYYFKSEYAKAKKWFEKLFASEEVTDKTLQYRYKQTLKALKASRSKETVASISEID
ncbi:hypothetical protein [Luteirhabdus pelagi]|jgi:hypothetical protein|uniref:hypothetical protein n=1 Tax=Luteirhabdus pelagi TaxID=2792783 RepID=UPI001939677D|nr:hypothetical protein [Luteirhabdus pelagi]